MNKSKFCKICGDEASGFNYKLLTCESCKVFFHRNFKNLNKFECSKQENCQIDVNSRRKCSKCRLVKCLNFGMIRKVTKLQESDNNSKNDILMCTIEKMFLLDELKLSLKTSKMNSCAKLIEKTKRQRAKKLNLYENEQLNFICKALSCFKEEGHLKVIKKIENPNDADFFGNPDIYVKNTILFCKQLEAFNCLNVEEQLAITKKATYDIWSLRFIFNYNPETQGSITFENEECTTGVFFTYNYFKNKHSKNHLVEELKCYCLNLTNAMEKDTQIRNLCSAIVLFQNYTNMPNLEFFKYNHVLYLRLLKRYFEEKHGSITEANRRFFKLTKLLDEIETAKQNEFEFFNDYGTNNFPAIFNEIMGFV